MPSPQYGYYGLYGYYGITFGGYGGWDIVDADMDISNTGMRRSLLHFDDWSMGDYGMGVSGLSAHSAGNQCICF